MIVINSQSSYNSSTNHDTSIEKDDKNNPGDTYIRKRTFGVCAVN